MSSWLRSAVIKAVEVGGNTTITRAVRTYADTVVGGGARLLQDRLGSRNIQSYKNAVKRLEEVSVSCRGAERVQLLRRWLVALNEIERFNKQAHQYPHPDLSDDPSQTPTQVLYYDPDLGGEPVNFRHVFLFSQALEGITLSMILEQPSDEEVSLLQEIFGLSLVGGKEAHYVTANYVRDLSKVFTSYDEEVLAKREELLQYAQDAIAGLKINPELERIDSQVSNLHKTLDDINKQLPQKGGDEKLPKLGSEKLKEALLCIRLCSELEDLLLIKKSMKTRETPIAHNEKVDKLKVLAESLASSASKSAKRISENRAQKEEALRFRVAKTSEVGQLEKDLSAEIKALSNRKDDLESELKKVTIALTSANARLQNAREERDQFDDANNQIVQLFKVKEDELSKSIVSYKSEGEVCNTFINFLENTRGFQSKSVQQTEQLVKDEWERHEEYFVNLAVTLLEAYKDKLSPSVSSVKELVDDLKRLDGKEDAEEPIDAFNTRRKLEEQYQKIESEFLTTFSVVESIKRQFCIQEEKNSISRKGNERVMNLIDALEKMKGEFDSIERPKLEIESPTMRDGPSSAPARTRNEGKLSLGLTSRISLPSIRTRNSDISKHAGRSVTMSSKNWRETEAQLAKLRLELELENHHSRESSMEGISDWEFDEKIEPRSI